MEPIVYVPRIEVRECSRCAVRIRMLSATPFMLENPLKFTHPWIARTGHCQPITSGTSSASISGHYSSRYLDCTTSEYICSGKISAKKRMEHPTQSIQRVNVDSLREQSLHLHQNQTSRQLVHRITDDLDDGELQADQLPTAVSFSEALALTRGRRESFIS